MHPTDLSSSASQAEFSVFTRIQIQTVSWCNRSCVFCPAGKFPTPKEFMEASVFQRLIDQLATIGFAGRISPYLMNESLLDRRLPDFITYARSRCPDSWIAINTNGDALSLKLACRLFDAGLNLLAFNAYESDNQFLAAVGLGKRISDLRSEIACGVGYTYPEFNGEGIPRNVKLFRCWDRSMWTPRFLAKLGTPDLQNRSGNIPGSRRLSAPLKLGCPRPFEQMYINC